MKKLVAGVGLLVLVVVLVVLVRTGTGAETDVGSTGFSKPKLKLDEQRIAAHLSEAIRFRTVSNDLTKDPGSRDHFLAFQDWLISTYPGFHERTERLLINDLTLLYQWPGADPALKPILLMAHYDVVPVANEANWQVPPFSGSLSDGFVWGRGALDDKASLVALMEAAELLATKDFAPARTILFAFGHDEEMGGVEGNGKLAETLRNQEVLLEWVLDEGGLIASGLVPGVDKPVALIGIAEKGSVTMELVATAPGGHSSMPPRVTAIGRLARALDRLQQNPVPGGLDELSNGMLDALSAELPFIQRMAVRNRWLFSTMLESELSKNPASDAGLRTTIAPTIIRGGVKTNVLPSEVSAFVNFRIHPRDTVQSLVDHVESVIDDPSVEVKANAGRPASQVSTVTGEGFAALTTAINEGFDGTLVVPYLTVAGTDSRYYESLSNHVYRFAPIHLAAEDRARFHGSNERVGVADLANAVRFYTRLMENGAQ